MYIYIYIYIYIYMYVCVYIYTQIYKSICISLQHFPFQVLDRLACKLDYGLSVAAARAAYIISIYISPYQHDCL